MQTTRPALDTAGVITPDRAFDNPHALTIRKHSDPYGCQFRVRQEGYWVMNVVFNQLRQPQHQLVYIKDVMSKTCKHNWRNDVRCTGCTQPKDNP